VEVGGCVWFGGWGWVRGASGRTVSSGWFMGEVGLFRDREPLYVWFNRKPITLADNKVNQNPLQ